LEDVFARALDDVRPSIEGQDAIGEEGTEGSTTQENEIPENRSQTPRSTRSLGGGLSAKPRRMSRSPFKQLSRTEDYTGAKAGQETLDPFKKTGLRRSPAGPQEPALQENINPFQKKGLRRSPISSQPLEPLRQGSVPPEGSTTPSPLPQTAMDALGETVASPLREPDDMEAPAKQTSEAPAEQADILPTTELVEVEKEIGQPLASSPQPPQPTGPPVSQRRPNQVEEPELPPTPTQRGILDPVVTTPPTGIHDTPSKRARRSKALSKKLKSSPLKPKDPPPPEPAKLAELDPVKKAQKEPIKRRKSARFSLPEDPHASKKQVRDDMLKELQQLQADIALANRENERLRLHYKSSRSQPTNPSNADELLALLVRSTASEPSSAPKPKPKSIFNSIGSFLPFSSSRKARSLPPAIEKPIPSHLPISVDDPLPYLQAFSPLTYTSNITLLPPELPPSGTTQEVVEPVLQQHLINASHLSGLFHARLSMTVDSSLLSIKSLDIQRLDPCAEKELGTFMRQRASEEAVLNRDIGVVCWAMGRWVEVSILRARFWCAIDHEFGTAEARTKSLQRKKKRKLPKAVLEDDDTIPLEGYDEDEETRKQKWTRKQLLPHMGRTSLELATDEVELRFEWRITFDWTGEVDSAISAIVRLPSHCELLSFLFKNCDS